MKLFRRILFGLLALTFLVLCPLLIFHTLGYLNTGLVVVEALPRNAAVLINGLQVARETPATLPHLPPGFYRVGVEREGYRPWECEVEVEKGQATVLDRVFLLPVNEAVETFAQGPFDTLLPVEGTPYILLLKKGLAGAVRVFNSHRQESTLLFPADASYAARPVSRVFTVPGSPYVLVQIDEGAQARKLWINLENDPSDFKDLSALIAAGVSHVVWPAKKPAQLFCFREGFVDKVDLNGPTAEQNFAAGWVGMGVVGQTVCGLDAEARFVRMSFDGKLLDTEQTELELKRRLFGKPRFIHILPLEDDTLLFHETGGRLLQTELPYLLAETGVEGLRPSAEEDGRVLVWRRHALGLLGDPGRKEREQVFAAGRQIRWIYEGGAEVTSPAFLYGGTYALCLLDDTVKIFDLRPGASGEPRDVCRVRAGTAIHYDGASGILYALHPDDARLVGIQVLAVEPLTLGNLSSLQKGFF